LAGRYSPGDWQLETYIKPSGVLGTPPEVGDLLEAALGTYTPPGTGCLYTLADTLPSFSIWLKEGHTIFAMAGCTVEQLVANVPGNAFGKFTFSGQGKQKYWAGTGTNASESAISQKNIVMTAGHEKRFCIGSLITIGADLGPGSGGYIIDAIDYSTHTIHVTENLLATTAALSAVVGWLPTSATEVGAPVFGKLGQMTLDYSSTPTSMNILSAEVTLKNNIKYYEDEKNNSLYISEYGRPKPRNVTVKLSAYFYKEHAQFLRDQWNRNRFDLVIPVGSTAGSICTIYCPALAHAAAAGVEINNPEITGDEEKSINLEGVSLASSSYNDELAIRFT
jgi:hypothetical protein